MLGVIVKPDGTVEQTDLNEEDRLKSMQKAVGGYVQHLVLNFHRRRLSIYVNEEGKLIDPPLPANNLATSICRVFGVGLMPSDYIAGNMLVTTGSAKGLSPSLAEEVVKEFSAIRRGERCG